MSDLKTDTNEEEFVVKKSINNDETLSALSAISAAAAQCVSALEAVSSSQTFASPTSESSTVARLEKAKRLDMLYHKMSISKKASGEMVVTKNTVAMPPEPPSPHSPPSPPARPEAEAEAKVHLTK